MIPPIAAHRKTPQLSCSPLPDQIPPPTLTEPSSSPTTHSSMLPVQRNQRGETTTTLSSPSAFFDLVIIGAGPAALAVLTRLLERRPAALYTEEEHRFLHWLDRSGRGGQASSTRRTSRSDGDGSTMLSGSKRVLKTRAKGSKRVIVGEKGLNEPCPTGCIAAGRNYGNGDENRPLRILVIDKIGDGWMAHWNRMFEALQIQHLRSPLFFHPCPADLDSLLAYAQRTGRTEAGDPSYVVQSNAGPRSKCGRSKIRRRNMEASDLEAAEKILMDASNGTSSSKRAGGRKCPDLVEIGGVVGQEVSKHHKRQAKGQSHRTLINGTDGTLVNERERKDYFTPSTDLFADFIREDVLPRYGLSNRGDWPNVGEALSSKKLEEKERPAVTCKGEVNSMTWTRIDFDRITDNVEDIDEPIEGFCLETKDGARIGARAVISAVGPSGTPSIPQALLDANKAKDKPAETPAPPALFGQGWCHSSALAVPCPPKPPSRPTGLNAPPKTLLVIGGGLTSAQIVDVALRKQGYDKVHLLLRGHLKIKPFDIGLEWMGRYSNLSKMQFWQEEDPKVRFEMIKDARRGGSIPSGYVKLLKRYEEEGKVKIWTWTELEEVEWDESGEKWNVGLKKTRVDPKEEAKKAFEESRRRQEEEDEGLAMLHEDSAGCHACDVSKTEQEQREATEAKKKSWDLNVDYIITASASKPDFAALPFMKQLAAKYPVRQEGGLPVVTEDLQYGQLPLFVVGMYSGLQIGPAAGNLGGTREAADRVVSRLQTLFADGSTSNEGLGQETVQEDHVKARNAVEQAENSPQPEPNGTRSGGRYTHFGFEALSLEA